MDKPVAGPHDAGVLATFGVPLAEARAVMILVHGRGATAAGMLELSRAFHEPRVAYLAPQAAGGTWYPHSFLAPLAMNEPGLSSGLAVLGATLERVEAAGIPAERVLLLGFSQGACLALEFAARRPARFGGVIGLSGGLIGREQLPDRVPPDDKSFTYTGSLAGCPILLACSALDPHIPESRVRQSAEVFIGMGASVETRIYPGASHTIREEEIEAVQASVARVLVDV